MAASIMLLAARLKEAVEFFESGIDSTQPAAPEARKSGVTGGHCDLQVSFQTKTIDMVLLPCHLVSAIDCSSHLPSSTTSCCKA